MKLSRNTFSERSLHGKIAHDLGKKIVKGHYKPGDILPNETQLCKNLNVSRTAVREAFKVLSSKGLLESRPKIGTRVRDKQDWNLLDADMLTWGLMEPVEHQLVDSLIELANLLLPQAAQLAIVQANEKQQNAIYDAWTKFTQRQITGQALIDTHLNLLNEIVCATNNALLSNITSLLIRSLGELTDADKWGSQLYHVLKENYHQLINAIKNRNPEQVAQPLKRIIAAQLQACLVQPAMKPIQKPEPITEI